MSVRPIAFQPNGDLEVVFDELGHTGTIPAADVKWSTNPMTGADDHNYIVLQCPDGCGSVSTWPVGGSDALIAQEMFLRKVELEGCCCAQVKATGVGGTLAQAADHVKELAIAMGGEERWKLDDTVLARIDAEIN